MAVEDKYVEANLENDKKPVTVAFTTGAPDHSIVQTEEIAAADDDGSVYRFFKAVPANWIPTRIEVYNDAITGGTDYDIGLYETKDANLAGGTVVDQDKLASALDMSSGAAKGSPKDGLGAVGIDEIKERLFELAGQTSDTKLESYDIALTAVTVGSAAGTVSMVAWFVEG